ncbi:hypothetical protein [Priestia sp. JNUCC 25]
MEPRGMKKYLLSYAFCAFSIIKRECIKNVQKTKSRNNIWRGRKDLFHQVL